MKIKFLIRPEMSYNCFVNELDIVLIILLSWALLIILVVSCRQTLENKRGWNNRVSWKEYLNFHDELYFFIGNKIANKE